MTVRLTTGGSMNVEICAVGIHYAFYGEQYDDVFIVLDLDDKLEVILGLPWLRSCEQTVVIWQHRFVKMPAA